MDEKFVEIINEMAEVLNAAQLKRLQEVMLKHLVEREPRKRKISNREYLTKFLEAKKMEGCSDRTIKYYKVTVEQLLTKVIRPIRRITTEEMREYLVEYQKINNCGKTTIDNIRRNISSFFSWLEEEDYILKSPMRRIHKIRAEKLVKNVITQGIFVAAMTILAYWIGVGSGGHSAGMTMAFCVLAFSQMLRAFNQRSNTEPIWVRAEGINPWLIVTFCVSAVLMAGILLIPAFRGMFSLTLPDAGQWAVIAVLSLLSVVQVEVVKWFRRRTGQMDSAA